MSALDLIAKYSKQEPLSEVEKALLSYYWGYEGNITEATNEFAKLQEQLKQVESNYDALQSPMPCGHLARYAVNNLTGDQLCVMCQFETLREHHREHHSNEAQS